MFFNKLFRKKSFEQIYSELKSKNTSKGKLSVLNIIHSYLQKYTFRELLLFNLKCNGIQYFPYCHYFFLALFATFSFTIGLLNIYILSVLNVSLWLESLLVVFSVIIVSFLIFILGVTSIKAGIGKFSWKKSVSRLYCNVVENIFIVIISYFITLILLYQIIQYIIFHGQVSTTLTILLEYPINIINTFYTYLSEFNIASVESSQLSLAGFYFSLAIGGTVIFSIIDRYIEEEDSLKMRILEQEKTFNDIYCKYKSSLNLDLSDIISFDYKSINLRRLNIKKIINFNYKNIKDFVNTLSNIQTKMDVAEITNKRILITKYNNFIKLVVFTYIIGIVTIFIPKEYATTFLWAFIIDSLFFCGLIFMVYMEYRK